jgi:hypothetical protein
MRRLVEKHLLVQKPLVQKHLVAGKHPLVEKRGVILRERTRNRHNHNRLRATEGSLSGRGGLDAASRSGLSVNACGRIGDSLAGGAR